MNSPGKEMLNAQLGQILKSVLGVDVLRDGEDANVPLLGAVPEFDSMAVVAVLTSIEDAFGIIVEDDEIDASVFETVGALADFVTRKLND